MQSQTLTGIKRPPQFIIREYKPGDMSSVLALAQLGLVGGSIGTWEENFWRWKHFDNPFGQSIVLVATNSIGQIIGLRALSHWRFKAGDTVVKAARAVDTVTHPDYRRYGVFSALTRRAVEQSKNSGIDLIYNTPNNQVLPGYLKLGWNYVSMIRPLVKVLNYPRFAAALPGILPNLKNNRSSGYLSPEQIARQRLPSVSEFLSLSGAVEQLLRSHGQTRDEILSTDRSIDYLRWRYSEYPKAKYAVFYQEKEKALSGCVILRPSTRFNLKEAVLSEMLFPKPDEGLASSFLDEMEKRLSADYIIAYYPEGSFERHILCKHGFHQIPRGGVNFTVNVLTSHMPCEPTILENWNICLGDIEVI